MSGQVTWKLDVCFDDDKEVASIDGTKISYAMFKHLSAITPPGYWFRVISTDEGVVTLEQRKFVDGSEESPRVPN